VLPPILKWYEADLLSYGRHANLTDWLRGLLEGASDDRVLALQRLLDAAAAPPDFGEVNWAWKNPQEQLAWSPQVNFNSGAGSPWNGSRQSSFVSNPPPSD
jgi:hypothetical protein